MTFKPAQSVFRRPFRLPTVCGMLAVGLLAAGFLAAVSGAPRAQGVDMPPAGIDMQMEDLAPTAAHVLQPMDDEAQRIYRRYGDALYQIQVIDLVTGKKTAIGSGFQFNKEGMVATNFHVVADAIHQPQANRLEFVHDTYGTGPLKILTADVRYDLAILQLEKPNPAYVELGHSDLQKGAKLFSLGNPHDIGFTIVEGTYNGVSRESFIDKIHFSGAVNPGMSGGPALGHDGKVVGINVMTAGNQIGFLVPVEPLRQLVVDYMAEAEDFDFAKVAQTRIQDQLLDAQARSLTRMQEKEWDSVTFDDVTVPGRIDPAFKCWGSQRHTDKSPYTHHRTTCATEDSIYLDDAFSTGSYSYSYDLLRASKRFGSLRFYNTYQEAYANTLDPYFYLNAQEEKFATNFVCNNRFVDIGEQRWKAAFCLRRYNLYPKLHDMQLFMAQLGHRRKGMIVTFAAQGVARDDGIAMMRRFIGSLKPVSTAPETPVPDLSGTTPTAASEPPAKAGETK